MEVRWMEALIGTEPSPEGLGMMETEVREGNVETEYGTKRRRTRRRHCNVTRRCLTSVYYKWKEEEEGEARRAWGIREGERLGKQPSWKSVCRLSMGAQV